MRDELAGDHIAADFPELPSGPRVSAGPLGSFGVGRKAIFSTLWIHSFEGLDTVDEQQAGPSEADRGTVLAMLRAKATRAERDPEYAAELEWAARAGLDEGLGDGDLLGEDEDWSAYEAAEYEAHLATMVEGTCCREPWTDPRHRFPLRLLAQSRLEDPKDASPPGGGVTQLPRGSDRIRVVVSFPHDFDARASAAIDALRGPAEDGDADAAALMGSCYEHRGDPEHAMTWYLQSHYGGSTWGTAALARISYDQGAKDQAARLMSAAWNADAVLIRRVFDLMDSSRTAEHPPARACPPEPLRDVIDKIRASLCRIPPVLPAASFDARVWKAAGANILVFRRGGELLGDIRPFLTCAAPYGYQPHAHDTVDGFETSSGDSGTVAAHPPDPLTGATADNHRLADDVRMLEEVFGLPPGGDDRPHRRRAAPLPCSSPDQ